MIKEDDLVTRLGIGRTPVREAIQRLERDQLVAVLPRQGVQVTAVDVSEMPLLFETRAILEPYVHRLAAVRGTEQHWQPMDDALRSVEVGGATWADLLAVDRLCHEQVWKASANRFLTETLEMLYTQSERLWHLYLRDRASLDNAIIEHRQVLDLLRAADANGVAAVIEEHVRSFERQTRRSLG